MPYTTEMPRRRETNEELRARIPGWGADLDPVDRPTAPGNRFESEGTGAHWKVPESQPELRPRERSIEHAALTPVFGTSVPKRGLSGLLRTIAYRRFGEARAAHWLILIVADRVDAIESHLLSFATLRPDNPITQTGVRAEFTHGGLRSRLRRGRVDLRHSWLDPIIVAGPWLLAIAGVAVLLRRAFRSGGAPDPRGRSRGASARPPRSPRRARSA